MGLFSWVLNKIKSHMAMVVLIWVLALVTIFFQSVSVWVGTGFIHRLLSTGFSMGAGLESNFLVSILNWIEKAVLNRETQYESLVAGVVVLAVSSFMMIFVRLARKYTFQKMSQTILKEIRMELFEKLTRLDLNFSLKNSHGKLASLLLSDVNAMEGAIFDLTDKMIIQPIQLLFAVFLIYSLSPKILLVAVLLLLVCGLIVFLAGQRIEKLSRIMMQSIANIQGHITDYLSVFVLTRSLGKETKELSKFDDLTEKLKDSTCNIGIFSFMVPQIISFLFTCVMVCLLLIGGYSVFVSQTMQSDTLMKIILLLPIATRPIEALSSLYVSLRSTLASVKRIKEILDMPDDIVEIPDAQPISTIDSPIVLSSVGFKHDRHRILQNVSFEIPLGKTIVIYGRSGSGKTTLLKLVAGFLRPTDGTITIGDKNLVKVKHGDWRNLVGIVTQEPVMINDTVRNNLLYAVEGAGDAELESVLRDVLLWEDECVFKDGLNTMIGNRGEMISGGERQRLSIARALLRKPELVLMDEPTSMMDYANKLKVMETIKNLKNKKTFLIVTHDPDMLELGDIKVKMDDGKVTEIS